MADEYDLQRFVAGQEGVYGSALAELRRGRKTSHWMWFIFPQMKGLGSSQMATFYGIGSRGEAEAYFYHPVLGSRLVECTCAMNSLDGLTVGSILGSPDDMKFRSSMTLFSLVVPDQPVFQQALDKYFGGGADSVTKSLLG